MTSKRNIVLAYSGGLDTTTIIPWLKEQYECNIIAVCVDVGQGAELDGLEERALQTGASQFEVVHAAEEFVTEYIWPTLKAQAIYEDQYLLGTSMARPLIAKKLVEVARREGADTICHGATGKGNDQVRFELAIQALAPDLKIIAPWRLWDLQSREDEMEYLTSRGIHLPFSLKNSYSRDANLWHMSHEGLDLENPANMPDYEALLHLANPLEKAANEAETLELTFQEGLPTHLNGHAIAPVDLIHQLNLIGGKHGIGVVDLVENRLVGMKSRGVYENPAGAILYAAHQQLEHICLDRQTYSFKQTLALKFAELVYNGLWFTPLREALTAFVDETQQTVSGQVRLKLYKGNILMAGVTSPYSLYDESLASFTTGALFDHHDAEGFINLFGLPLKVKALLKQKQASQKEASRA